MNRQCSTSVLVATLALAACDEAEPRPQLIVVIDSDAPVAGQLASHPELSADAAIDTVRVDVLAPDGTVRELRELVAPEPIDWPLSFGIATPEDGSSGALRIRIRAFRGARAVPDLLVGALEPPREAAIDRLIDLVPPADGVVRLRALLTLACFGASPSFLEPATTCLDAARPSAPPSEPLEPSDGAASLVGSSPLALEEPCVGPPPVPSAVCIPGGFTLIGDASLQGLEDLQVLDPLPLRPARLSPFWIDQTELTVGRFRAILARSRFEAPLPRVRDDREPLARHCTFLGPDDAANDALPLTCLIAATGAEACALEGGALASEAQWEHAARGRGQGRRYPWGQAPAACCIASAGRDRGPCSTSGIEPVGSHPLSPRCFGLGDVSRDGVLDLGGSVLEYTGDAFRPYDDPCWSYAGVALDPRCQEPGEVTSRGGSWDQSLSLTVSALRHGGTEGPSTGFRCAYEDG